MVPTVLGKLLPAVQINGTALIDSYRNSFRARYSLITSKHFDPLDFTEVCSGYTPPHRSGRRMISATVNAQQLDYLDGEFDWYQNVGVFEGQATLLLNQQFDPNSFYLIEYLNFPKYPSLGHYNFADVQGVSRPTQFNGGLQQFANMVVQSGVRRRSIKVSLPAGLSGTVNLTNYRVA